MASADRRLDELAELYELSPHTRDILASFLELLADPLAATAVHVPEQAVDVHIADALTGLRVAELRAASRIADLGSGAGVPGLVLAAALPDARVDLVESIARKCGFLEAAIQRLGLSKARVVQSRVEEWADGAGVCDAVTARAVAPLAVLCEYAAPLLRPGGVLVAWKGQAGEREVADGVGAAAVVGLEPREILRTEPFSGSRVHTLHLYSKVGVTPDRFPRRPGMAAKRPLGADSKP